MDLTGAFGKGFDAKRKILLGKDAKLVLLAERDGDDGAPFNTVRTVLTGWTSKFSEFFGTTTFKVANISESFGADVRNSTHVMVTDSKMPALNNTLHELQTETAPPDGDKPFWRVRAKSVGRKFIPPDEI